MKLDLIEFYELRNTEEIVNEFLKQQPDIKLPLDIYEIVKAFGIFDTQEVSFTSMQGALLATAEKSNGIILVNSTISNKQRKRFTIAHELGHFLLPNHNNNLICTKDDISFKSQAPIEREANEFASEILMPSKLFTSEHFFKAEPEIENIIRLAKLFDVSLQACCYKYASLNHYPIAIVFSNFQQVTSFCVNKNDIPFWLVVSKDDKLPHLSLTNKYKDLSSGEIRNDLVDSSIWFEESIGYELPESIVEEVLIQEKGHAITLLYFEDEILEKE